jgi:hypothetical protein
VALQREYDLYWTLRAVGLSALHPQVLESFEILGEVPAFVQKTQEVSSLLVRQVLA